MAGNQPAVTALAALVVGVLAGSTPTAGWLGRLRGVDLRAEGSGNPGANNAFQLGGAGLGGTVLVVEMAKGFAAVWLGHLLAGAAGAALAGLGATAGNVYNPWYRLGGGKGLAITGGTLLAAWPALALLLVAVIAGAVAAFRRSGPAALVALGVYAGAAAAGLGVALPGRWAVDTASWAAVMAAGQAAVMAPRHLADARAVRGSGRPGSRGGS